MGPVHREEHQICGERAATGCRLREERLPSTKQCDHHARKPELGDPCEQAGGSLVMLYRIANNLVDVTTSALTAAHTRTTRNTHHYLQPSTHNEAYKHSFFLSTIKTWNKCTQQLVSKQSLDSFRRHLHTMPT